MSVQDMIAATVKLAKQWEQGLLTDKDYRTALARLFIVR
jgi:hypothetical protein